MSALDSPRVQALPSTGTEAGREVSRSAGVQDAVFRLVALSGLVVASYLPTLLQHFISNPYGDFGLHIGWVADLARGHIARPHFLFHLCTLIVWRLVRGIAAYTAGIIVTIGFNILLALVFYHKLPRSIAFAPPRVKELARMGLAVALLLVGPVSLITWPNRYLGYIGINPTHNPTIVALKPFAVLLFFYGCWFLTRASASSTTIAACSAVTVLGTLAKPSFLIVFLPVLFVAAAWRLIDPERRRDTSWNGLLGGILVPGALILVWQFWFEYGNPEASTVVFAPLREFRLALEQVRDYSRVQLGIPMRLLLSCLFPAAVWVSYFKVAKTRVDLSLAWGGFAIGVGYFLLLQETDKAGHGNFGWSAQIALLVLFFVSLLFLLERADERAREGRSLLSSMREIACMAIFALHLISGIVFVRYPYLL